MEIITIETELFEQMISQFENLAHRVEALHRNNSDKSLQKWLDNQEACEILCVSKRGLQTYRETGKLAFTQIGHKI